MAFTVTTQVHEVGQSIGVCHFAITSDATEDLTAQILLDISTLAGTPTSVKVKAVRMTANFCMAMLLWDQTTDELIASACAGQTVDVDFIARLGAPLAGVNTGGTGDIVMTTRLGNGSIVTGMFIFTKR